MASTDLLQNTIANLYAAHTFVLRMSDTAAHMSQFSDLEINFTSKPNDATVEKSVIDRFKKVIKREGVKLRHAEPKRDLITSTVHTATEVAGAYTLPDGVITISPVHAKDLGALSYLHELAHHFDFKLHPLDLLKSMADTNHLAQNTALSEIVASWVAYLVAEDYGLAYEGALYMGMHVAHGLSMEAGQIFSEGHLDNRIERVYREMKTALEDGG